MPTLSDLPNLIWFLIIGAVAGWLSGVITKGKSFGFIGNIIVGVLGAIIGGHTFKFIGVSITGGNIGNLITAFIGAIMLLFIIGLIKK
jgi:uncharacterized membrane protein YeaQ/YmgE (transglycosylase-associated protein family)